MTGTDLAGLLAERRMPAAPVDVPRMHRDCHRRLQVEMARQGVDVAVLLHAPHVAYATGCAVRGVDVTHAVFERPVAVAVAGHDTPHLLVDGLDPGTEVTAEVHPAVWPELDEGAAALRRWLAEVVGPLAGRQVAVDEQTGAMVRAGVLGAASVVDAGPLMAAAKVTKTADELACIGEAQRRNEAAMVDTQAALVPGARRAQVVAVFLARLRELGVAANLIDPILQPMPRRLADGPRTTTGGVAFPTGAGDPAFATGDLVWVDSGIDHLGYASDFGRTWVVGRDPDDAEVALHQRWCAVMTAVLGVLGPGVSAAELGRTAEAADADGSGRPWLPHFYLAHGVGIESAEMPLVGTDLGSGFDEALTMAPGMVLVLEPVIWSDGVGGYRAEEIVAVTTDGWCHLGGGHPYAPFGP
jgi:Xaa-Pro aminopeptidase